MKYRNLVSSLEASHRRVRSRGGINARSQGLGDTLGSVLPEGKGIRGIGWALRRSVLDGGGSWVKAKWRALEGKGLAGDGWGIGERGSDFDGNCVLCLLPSYAL